MCYFVQNQHETSVLIKISITWNSIFPSRASLSVSVSVRSSQLYTKCYHTMIFFGNFIFACIAWMFSGNLNNFVFLFVMLTSTAAGLIWAIDTLLDSIAQVVEWDTSSICTLVLTAWTSYGSPCGFFKVTKQYTVLTCSTQPIKPVHSHSHSKRMNFME